MKHLLMTAAVAALTATTAMPASDDGQDARQNSGTSITAGGSKVHVQKLLDMDVYAPGKKAGKAQLEQGVEEAPDSWQQIGGIGDVVLTRDGEVRSVVIEAGGSLDLEDKEIELKMDQMTFVEDTDDKGQFFVVYTGDRDKLKKQGEFDREKAEREGTSSFQASMQDGDRKQTQAQGDQMSGEQKQAGASGRKSGSEQSGKSDVALSDGEKKGLTAEELKGVGVYSNEEESVGEVSNVLLSEEGKMQALVLDVGGFLGLGEKTVALDFNKLDIHRKSEDGELSVHTKLSGKALDELEPYEE